MAAALLGMVYGGVPAARLARQRFIQQSHAEVFHSRVDAIVSAGGERPMDHRQIPTVNPMSDVNVVS